MKLVKEMENGDLTISFTKKEISDIHNMVCQSFFNDAENAENLRASCTKLKKIWVILLQGVIMSMKCLILRPWK